LINSYSWLQFVKLIEWNNENDEDEQEGQLYANNYQAGLKQITQPSVRRELKQGETHPPCSSPEGVTLKRRGAHFPCGN